MSNTNNKNALPDAIIFAQRRLQDLPPLPPQGAIGPEVCAIIHLYLAVWQDVTPAQRQAVSLHVQSCPRCQNELSVLQRATQIVYSLPSSEPSVQVDQALLAAIRARRQADTRSAPAALPPRPLRSRKKQLPMRFIGVLAAAAILILALAFSVPRFINQPLQAFTLPTNLSWNNYVLFSKQAMTNAQGEHYQVMTYHQMQANVINVETVMNGKLDVVVVKDPQKALGLDMMHHVAQWDAQSWVDDTKFFDLDRLRHDLSTGSAVYLGKDHFNGKDVYRIRYPDGHILILDMDYMPVNILPADKNNGTPMYETIQWLYPSKVSASVWSMQVPDNFRMGQLPRHP
ncbi:hypothetical protein KDW_25570 [Dictyobacter vulcani]|uniref:Zinc-finger domain-containing protein n=1 Tax=Dictyobacter vulcani TaxID=2607529 RepID=A0A5J4KKK9_9CHLR|nr:hypothetical protein [Dictyobacter vulcani]GER88395.1 hypothetical protein KDW_25570 [Dictyobacter vulcani]